jgi:sulfatase maturation enzyme AslB (radical SAM superfamily)
METIAISLFSSIMCQLSCHYCDFKNNDINKQRIIIDYIQSEKFIKDIKRISPNLQILSLWGAEPTYTLDIITNLLPKIKHEFPTINEIALSTNLLNVEPLKRFLLSMKKINLKSSVQFSIDGQKEITSLNRCGGCAPLTDKIIENISEMLGWLQDKELNLEFFPKPTWHGETFKYFVDNQKEVEKYYEFMTNLSNNINKITTTTKRYKPSWGSPSFAIPGYYNEEDCKNFKIVCDLIKEARLTRNDLVVTYPQEFSFISSLYSNTKALSLLERGCCSAGNSSFGINEEGKLCFCHAVFPDRKSDNTEQGNICIAEIDEEARIKYVVGGYIFYPELSYSITTMMVNELAENGFIPEVYKNNIERRNLLALMGVWVLNCPHDNIMQGSIHLRNLDLLRMWGYVEYEKYIIEGKYAPKTSE